MDVAVVLALVAFEPMQEKTESPKKQRLKLNFQSNLVFQILMHAHKF